MLFAGLLIAALGAALLLWGDRLLRGWRLPGDIVVRRPGFTLYLPLGTCILASLVLTAVLWLFSHLRR